MWTFEVKTMNPAGLWSYLLWKFDSCDVFSCRLSCRSRYNGQLTYNREECLPCFCYGHSDVCTSAQGYSIHNITSTFERGEIDALKMSVNHKNMHIFNICWSFNDLFLSQDLRDGGQPLIKVWLPLKCDSGGLPLTKISRSSPKISFRFICLHQVLYIMFIL